MSSGVLVVSLGCETIEGDKVAQAIAATGQDTEFLGIQESGGIRATVELGVAEASRLARTGRASTSVRRSPYPN